jgi:hypothetical protein
MNNPHPLHRRRAPSRKGMRVTGIALPAEMHRRLAILAVTQGTVMTEIVREALAAYLDRPAPRRNSA